MKLGEVFRFEVEYRLRRASTWVYGVVLVALPFLLMHSINGAGGYLNAPWSIAFTYTTMGLLGVLVTAALVGDAATRDVAAGVHPLFYTAPIRRTDYLGGRFLGALAVNAVLLAGIPVGLLLASWMPYMEPERFGPFIPAAYVQPYLLFSLPNLVLSAATLFAVAALTRSTLATYLAAVGLLVGYLVAVDFAPANPQVAALLDPFGGNALEAMKSYWTPAERNTRLIGFPEILLWNRLLWLGVAAGVLGLLHLRFRFAHPARGGRRRLRRASGDRERPGAMPDGPVVVPPAPRQFGARARARQTIAIAGESLRQIVVQRTFLVVLAGALFITFAFGWDVGTLRYGTSSWPVTHLVAGVLSGPVSTLVAVLIAVFAGELVWKERDARISDVADAAPVPDRVSFAGRFLALAGMIVLLQAVLTAAGMTLQALQGYTRFEPGVYLRILFGLKLADYLIFAALAVAVHVVVDHKYAGHLIVVLFYAFTMFAGQFGIRHNLLVYGADPGWLYSDMNGFGPFLGPWLWFKVYWAAWALLFALVASLFWVRGRESGARRRIAVARARFTRAAAGAAAVAAVLIVSLGGFIFYNTNVLNEYRTPFESAEVKAEYERRYKQYEDAAQPRIERADLRVEIHPDEPAADLRGSYQLVNRTTQAIDSIHLVMLPGVRARSFSFDRAAERVLDDGELRYRVYVLDRPLPPGDSLRLRFDLAIRPRGFPNSGIPTEVVENGTYFDRLSLPIVGYQPALELTDAKTRRDHGLPHRPGLAAPNDAQALQHREPLRDAKLVDTDFIIGTAIDQIAVTSGFLRREWTENGRRYFHYRAEAPLPFDAAVLSARYAVREDRWNGVALRIYHHPTHSVNLERMFHGMKALLDYNTRSFGPYPYPEMRIVESPLYHGSASAHPHTVAFSEGSAFLTRVEEGDLDRTFFVVAHETAHQWWGNQQVSGAQVRGAGLISEALAQYSAMMTVEKALGPDQARRFYDHEMDHYLGGRTGFATREVPLLEVEDQSYLYYHKGAVAMYTLRDRIGEERVNTALRRFLEKYRAAGPPYPTSRDLYRELQAVTPDTLQSLLRDLFEEITLWDVRAEAVRAEPTGSGEYRVTLDVVAKKVRADSVGVETEIPMDDLVEIGVFAAGGPGGGPGAPLYLRHHRIRSGRQTITVVVPREPAWAGIDPWGKLIQRERGDNTVNVEEPAGAAPADTDRATRTRTAAVPEVAR